MGTSSCRDKCTVRDWKNFDYTKVKFGAILSPNLVIQLIVTLQIFRVSNAAHNSVHLSNFSAKRAGYCGYSQVYNSRGIKEASGEVIVLKSNEIKECKWISFNGTFAQLPGQFFGSTAFA